MSNLTYRDIPVLRSAGFEVSSSGASWFGTDNTGAEWQAVEDDDTGLITFSNRSCSMPMTRDRFQELFGGKNV